MRELDRNAADTSSPPPGTPGPTRIGILGAGRVGTALAQALRAAGCEVDGPAGRSGGALPAGDALLLCVPDSEIPAAASAVAGRAPLVGHTSGATPISALAASGADTFGLHPLQTVPAGAPPGVLGGCGCAIAGSTDHALAAAASIARRAGMRPFEIEESRRGAYHAAASIASNFLVTLEAAAEAMAGEAGLEPDDARALLAPLVRRTVENWESLGPERALTGPVARGDEVTVEAQRRSVEVARPELLPLFDALLERTRSLAAGAVPA